MSNLGFKYKKASKQVPSKYKAMSQAMLDDLMAYHGSKFTDDEMHKMWSWFPTCDNEHGLWYERNDIPGPIV